MEYWQTSRRRISLERPLVMGILNVTPDSFSDGGQFLSVDTALHQAEKMIADGVDIIDIGGESTRPNSVRVSVSDEIARVVPVIRAVTNRFDTPVSIDTSRASVAQAAIDTGAEIVNDVSALRWDASIADLAARANAGIVLMHSRGTFETMHSQPPVDDAVAEVSGGLAASVKTALDRRVPKENIVLDIGLGFGKTPRQNFDLLAKLDTIVESLRPYPLLVGASRKSFLKEVAGDVEPLERMSASVQAAVMAVTKGAKAVRVHDVRETVQALNFLRIVNDGV